MRKFVFMTLSSVLVLACSAAPVAPGAGAGGGTSSGSGGGAGGEPTLDVPAAPVSRLSPSGAFVRLANAYAPLNGDPGSVDVFGGYAAQEGQAPLATVGYEEVGDWFDPGADSDGNVAMSWYPSGRTSDDDKLGDQTETLRGGERITVLLTSGGGTNPAGARYGQWLTVFEEGGTSEPLATPGDGAALLFTESFGLPNTYGSEPLFISAGNGCLVPQGGTNGPQPVGPGGSAAFELEPGNMTLSIHSYPAGGFIGELDCSVPAVLEDIEVDLDPGERAILLLYAPAADDLRALIVPIED